MEPLLLIICEDNLILCDGTPVIKVLVFGIFGFGMNKVKQRGGEFMKITNTTKMLPAIVIGSVVSIVVCIAAALIGPVLVLEGTVEGVSLRIIASIVRFLAVMVGILVATHVVEDKKLITAIACAALHILVMILSAITFFVIDETALALGFLSAVLGMLCAFIAVIKRNKQLKHRHKTRRSR